MKINETRLNELMIQIARRLKEMTPGFNHHHPRNASPEASRFLLHLWFPTSGPFRSPCEVTHGLFRCRWLSGWLGQPQNATYIAEVADWLGLNYRKKHQWPVALSPWFLRNSLSLGPFPFKKNHAPQIFQLRASSLFIVWRESHLFINQEDPGVSREITETLPPR